jgi:NADH dehydrogenase FAD-containing subunit
MMLTLQENVRLVTETIAEITETGIKTKDGKEYPVDTIVYATGS